MADGEMMERVGEAIKAAMLGQMEPQMVWGKLEESGELNFEILARAAIEAMREPTELMANEGWDAACAMVLNQGRRSPQACFAIGGETPVWQAMIDAALFPSRMEPKDE